MSSLSFLKRVSACTSLTIVAIVAFPNICRMSITTCSIVVGYFSCPTNTFLIIIFLHTMGSSVTVLVSNSKTQGKCGFGARSSSYFFLMYSISSFAGLNSSGAWALSINWSSRMWCSNFAWCVCIDPQTKHPQKLPNLEKTWTFSLIYLYLSAQINLFHKNEGIWSYIQISQ